MTDSMTYMAPVDGTLPLAAAEGRVSRRIGRLNVMKWRGWNMAVVPDSNRNQRDWRWRQLQKFASQSG